MNESASTSKAIDRPPANARPAGLADLGCTSCATGGGVDRLGIGARQSEDHRAEGAVPGAGRPRASRRARPGPGDRVEHTASASRAAKRAAARIGPTVCELDGPMPMENRSKTLTATRPLGLGATSTLGGSADGSGVSGAPRDRERDRATDHRRPAQEAEDEQPPPAAMLRLASLLQHLGQLRHHLLDRLGLLGEFVLHERVLRGPGA